MPFQFKIETFRFLFYLNYRTNAFSYAVSVMLHFLLSSFRFCYEFMGFELRVLLCVNADQLS